MSLRTMPDVVDELALHLSGVFATIRLYPARVQEAATLIREEYELDAPSTPAEEIMARILDILEAIE